MLAAVRVEQHIYQQPLFPVPGVHEAGQKKPKSLLSTNDKMRHYNPNARVQSMLMTQSDRERASKRRWWWFFGEVASLVSSRVTQGRLGSKPPKCKVTQGQKRMELLWATFDDFNAEQVKGSDRTNRKWRLATTWEKLAPNEKDDASRRRSSSRSG